MNNAISGTLKMAERSDPVLMEQLSMIEGEVNELENALRIISITMFGPRPEEAIPVARPGRSGEPSISTRLECVRDRLACLRRNFFSLCDIV